MLAFNHTIADEIRKIAALSGTEALFYGSVEEGTVYKAETVLGVSFPPSYRSYLRYLGAAKMFGHDFDGLPDNSSFIDEPPLYLNVVDHTLLFREEVAFFTKSMILLTDDGGSLLFYLETSITDNEQECPVLAHYYGRQFFIGSSFLEFVRLLSHRSKFYESIQKMTGG